MSASNFFRRVLSSGSFANFSTMYFKYLKVAGGIGCTIGLGGSIAHLLDNRNKRIKAQSRILKKAKCVTTDGLTISELDEYESYESSYLYNFGVLVGGPLIGTSGGVMWPAVITLGPIYYVFGDYLGPIVAALLTISASIIDEDRKRIEDKDRRE